MNALRNVLLVALTVATFVTATAAPPAADGFAAAKRAAQVAARGGNQEKRREALEALAEFPTPESVDLIIRVGLGAKDEPTRSAASKLLARMARAGEEAPPGGDGESATAIGSHLDDLLARELKGKGGAGAVAVGLATAIVSADAAGMDERIVATLDGAAPTALPLCWGVATAAAGDGAEGVPVLEALAGLRRFTDDFSFRRGVVRGLIAIHEPRSVVALIDLLGKLRGEVRADVAGYLAAISGKNLGIDAGAWREWWTSAGETFVFPPRQASYPVPTVAPGNAGNAYYEIPVYAERIVFVIDTSLSMEGVRMETAKRELVSAIHTLAPDTLFTVVAFSDAARGWQPQLVEASDDAKRGAAGFVRGLVAAGKTASFDALDAAFRYDAEAIFFLSDGKPTTGKMVNPADIVRFVAEANKNRRLSLHTIGIMPDAGLATFLQALASANNGAYRHVAD